MSKRNIRYFSEVIRTPKFRAQDARANVSDVAEIIRTFVRKNVAFSVPWCYDNTRDFAAVFLRIGGCSGGRLFRHYKYARCG